MNDNPSGPDNGEPDQNPDVSAQAAGNEPPTAGPPAAGAHEPSTSGYPAATPPSGYPAASPSYPGAGYPAPAAPGSDYPATAPGSGYPTAAPGSGYPTATPGTGYPAPGQPSPWSAPATGGTGATPSAAPTVPLPAASTGAQPSMQPAGPASWQPTPAYQPGAPAWQPGQPFPGHATTGQLPPPPPAGTTAGYGSGSPDRNQTIRRFAIAGVAAVAIAIGAGGVGGFVGYALHGDTAASSPFQVSNNSGGGNAPIVDRSSLASIAASVQPTVVVINETGNAEGSGVIISSDGYIVTNNHVVADARGNTVSVTFNSGRKVQASIVGTDAKTDLAVVKASVTGLSAATWGDSDKVQVGDTVLAIGSPLGLQGSVTAGIVSALHRTITEGGDQTSPFEAPSATVTIGDAIQTDAPINPGNSGGALVDTQGHVIGINSAIATSGSNGNIGVGFAISANKAKSVTDQLIKGGKVSHPYLGVSVGDAQQGGAQVQQVVSGGPADKAGMRSGDVVTKINGTDIANSEQLVGAIQSSTVGSQLSLTVARDGSTTTITVTVGEAP